tara:strand:+ start:117 stop:398 length:282 start_codon:yes stop_codon:yes gene_type:complete
MQREIIQKERIDTLNFGSTEVLENNQERTIRTRRLKRAEQLGNAYKSKAKIAFKSLEGLFRVETTVWATTEKFVSLKGGILIPIHCIKGVEFY